MGTADGKVGMKYMYMYMHLGVLCCFALFVCLTLLASFFLPSHLSFKNMHMQFMKTQCDSTLHGHDRIHMYIHSICNGVFVLQWLCNGYTQCIIPVL